jgi:hypothetical protein
MPQMLLCDAAGNGKGHQRSAGKRQGLSKILNASYLIYGLGEWLKVGKQERSDTLFRKVQSSSLVIAPATA